MTNADSQRPEQSPQPTPQNATGDASRLETAIGERVIRQLAVALNSKRLYEAEHPSVQQALRDAEAALAELLRSVPEVSFKFIANEVVLESRPLFRAEPARPLWEDCSRRMIQVLTFRTGITLAELNTLIELLDTDPPAIEARGGPHQFLNELEVKGVTAETAAYLDLGEAGALLAGTPLGTHFSGVNTVKQSMQCALDGLPLDPSGARAVASQLVEHLRDDPGVLLSLTALKAYDEYTFSHCVNLSLLAICLGHYLGVAEDDMLELAAAGLLHDVGKVFVPLAILRKPGKMNDDEWDVMSAHPRVGARILFETEDVPLVAPVIAFEHHLRWNLSGYPKLTWPRRLHPYSVMITLGDIYDALTSARPYRKPFSPPEALAVMAEGADKDFQPELLAAFQAMMGAFPIGTVVRLSDRSLAVVTRPGLEPNSPPTVAVVADSEGHRLEVPEQKDLAQSNAPRIDATVDPHKLALDPQMVMVELLGARAREQE